MTSDPHELISAFVDGEAVEAEALSEALSAPGGREALIDYVRLRALLDAEDLRPSAEFYASMERVTAPRRRRPLAAAALLAAALILAVAGVWRFGPGPRSLQASAPGSPSAAVAAAGETRATPPEVKRVIRFTPGVDWHSES